MSLYETVKDPDGIFLRRGNKIWKENYEIDINFFIILENCFQRIWRMLCYAIIFTDDYADPGNWKTVCFVWNETVLKMGVLEGWLMRRTSETAQMKGFMGWNGKLRQGGHMEFQKMVVVYSCCLYNNVVAYLTLYNNS